MLLGYKKQPNRSIKKIHDIDGMVTAGGLMEEMGKCWRMKVGLTGGGEWEYEGITDLSSVLSRSS